MRILSFKATRRSKKRNQIFKLSIFKELKIGVEYGKDVYSDTFKCSFLYLYFLQYYGVWALM